MLTSVLPFLESTIHQEYLVKRYRELAKDNLISQMIWNAGASYKGKPWTEDYPSDAQLVMNAFCTYMNSKLPSQTNNRDAKSFTGQYFRTKPCK